MKIINNLKIRTYYVDKYYCIRYTVEANPGKRGMGGVDGGCSKLKTDSVPCLTKIQIHKTCKEMFNT